MSSRAFRIATIRGVDVRVDASWVIIAALVTWSLWGQFTMVYGQGGAAAVVMALVAAVLFFSSVLAHELAHALEAQRRGVTVGGITLFMFGGVTESKFDVRRPVDEFSLTVVGPLTSLGLALVSWVVSATAAGVGLDAVAQVAGILGWVNLALGLFNLLPGAPLDGGRLLRAAVWKVTGDRRRAIHVAAQAGRVVGTALITIGILQLLFVSGALFGGLWIALIGWFLTRGAAAELAQARLMELFEHVPARQLALREGAVHADEPVSTVLDRWAWTDAPDVMPVADNGNVTGVVSVDDIRTVPDGDRAATTVGDVMRPLADLPTVEADLPASRALDGLQERGVVTVADHGRAIGVITVERFAAVAQRRAHLDHVPTVSRPRR